MATDILSKRGRFSVYGNCQADVLTNLLLQSPAFAQLYDRARLAPCYLIKAEEIEAWRGESAPKVALFISQKLRPNWRGSEIFDPLWLLAQTAQGAVHFQWSDMYYKAYEPHMAYPLTMARLPPVDYLNLFHVLAFVNDLPWQAILPLYREADLFSPELVERFHLEAQKNLAEREADCSLQVAPFIARNWRSKRLFHSFNHPAREVIRDAAAQVLRGLGLEDDIPQSGYHAFNRDQSTPLPAAFARCLAETDERPFKESFSLRNKAVSAAQYFGEWQASLEAVGKEKMRIELAQQRKERQFAGPVLEIAARRLNIGLPE